MSPTASWSEEVPDHVVIDTRCDGRAEHVRLMPMETRRLASEVLDAAEAAERHASRGLPRGPAERAAARRALLEILDAARRLAVLYGIERPVVDADSFETLAERLGRMAGRSRR